MAIHIEYIQFRLNIRKNTSLSSLKANSGQLFPFVFPDLLPVLHEPQYKACALPTNPRKITSFKQLASIRI